MSFFGIQSGNTTTFNDILYLLVYWPCDKLVACPQCRRAPAVTSSTGERVDGLLLLDAFRFRRLSHRCFFYPQKSGQINNLLMNIDGRSSSRHEHAPCLPLTTLNYSWLRRWIKGEMEAVGENQAEAVKWRKSSNCRLTECTGVLVSLERAPCDDKQSNLFPGGLEVQRKTPDDKRGGDVGCGCHDSVVSSCRLRSCGYRFAFRERRFLFDSLCKI